MLMPSSAVSGMMLSFVPACRRPTVTTADSAGGTSRATMPWSLVTTFAAISTGSTVASGREPWPPLPWRVTFRESAAAISGPEP